MELFKSTVVKMSSFLPCHVLLFTLLPCHVLLVPPPPAQNALQYSVVVDAGSSGSRSRVYTWPTQSNPNMVPNITEVYSYKEQPGISAFAGNLDGLNNYVRKLVTMAADHVPQGRHHETVLYFMATAGMRLLLENKANAVMDKINSILLQPDNNPFSYEPLNTRILSGEEEGVFAWISVNYLSGFFNRHAVDAEEDSTGIVEMGGASLQVAFQPDGSILADKFPVKVGGTIYPIYVHSYLYYGQNYADLWVKQYLFGEREEKNNIQNPCMLKDDVLTVPIHGNNVTYIGTGQPQECAEILDVYVYKVDPRRCHPKPCTIGAVYQPSIRTDQNFYGIGAIIFPLRLLKVLEPDGTFSPRETNSSAYEYCMKDISTVQQETGRNDSFLSVECLTGLYIPTLLVNALHFSPDSRQFRAVQKINGQPTEWALGAIIYESERRRDLECSYPDIRTSPSVSSAVPPGSHTGIMALALTLTLFLTSQWTPDAVS